MNLVELRDISWVLGGLRVLDKVSWTVGSGQRWVVLGANGAGKTSLLHAASRLASCDLVGLVADQELAPDATALDTVALAAYGDQARRPAQWEPAEADRALTLLAQLGCRGLVGRRFGALSEGERRRVLIARALMPDPELLLLDEPAAGLDLPGREALVHWLNRISADPQSPVTVIVTHHVEEIPPATTHALLLRAGRVVTQGSVQEVLTGANLSRCFGLPISCERVEGRWSARLTAG